MALANSVLSLKRGSQRALMLSGAALLCLASAVPAYAQEAPDEEQASATEKADIVVTGTRITTSGYRAPTPTQVLTSDDLAKSAQPNVFNTVIQLPSLMGSTGATVNTNSTTSGLQGLSSFSLRGLGPVRTLTLLDGQRVVPANVTGIPDISLFPQLLIERVDVVTGGASASYGSDAVGGVVNFITNKKFKGFKANVAGGISTYGDNKQGLVQFALGGSLFDDRLHIQTSAEFDKQQGVPAGGFGEEMANGRNWYTTATLINRGVTNDGSPQYLYREHAQAYQYTKYGLITSGPLQGTAFDASGQPFTFQYGSGGVPARNAGGQVIGCFNFCVGGDLSGNVGIGTTLQSKIQRLNSYTRVGFDLDANNEIYFTANIAQVKSSNQPNPGAARTGITLQCSNPFVPALVQQACTANNITSFQVGVSNAILPNISVEPKRTQYRFVIGADGKFEALGTDWDYNAYFQTGKNVTDLHVRDILLIPRFNAAVQAISLNGQIVCANPVARASGCVPVNILGGTPLTAAQRAYLTPENGPFQYSVQRQDAAGVSFSGEPFSSWAGPISLAFGGEYRREAYRVLADPYANGVTALSPNSAAYPADPLLNAVGGGNWYAGNYRIGRGGYNVVEAYLESNVPLLADSPMGSANLNLAGRWTKYSTTGTVYTWKIGGTWDTPLEGVRLRAVTSRDVRAPNLSEQFSPQVSINVPNFTNPFNNTTVNITQNTVGNPNLRPESARNTELGIVFSGIPALPGFSLSFDHYNIKIKGAISALGAQQQVNLCFGGIQQLCNSFFLNDPTNTANYVNVQPFNLASISTKGFDIEMSQRFENPFGMNGRFTLRGLATHVSHYITNPGLPGAISSELAGVNAGATPKWKLLAVQSWDSDKFNLTFQQRWFSDGKFGNQYVVCSAGNCPVSTANNPTIDFNKMKGELYLDLSASYNINKNITMYARVDNLTNNDPTPSPQTNTGVDVNPALYDTVGRMFRFGVRLKY